LLMYLLYLRGRYPPQAPVVENKQVFVLAAAGPGHPWKARV
jgi:hypothetical protein